MRHTRNFLRELTWCGHLQKERELERRREEKRKADEEARRIEEERRKAEEERRKAEEVRFYYVTQALIRRVRVQEKRRAEDERRKAEEERIRRENPEPPIVVSIVGPAPLPVHAVHAVVQSVLSTSTPLPDSTPIEAEPMPASQAEALGTHPTSSIRSSYSPKNL